MDQSIDDKPTDDNIIEQSVEQTSEPAGDKPTFADLLLSPKVVEAVVAAGYTTPTPIQLQAIPVAVTGRDVLGIAQTGTGKTASFTLPMITRLEKGRARARMPRSLILAPTRELAAQVAQSFEKYGVNHKLSVALLIGGVSFVEQERKLNRGVDVLIATPGRMIDHFQRGKLLLNGVEILVIDEADRMLDMGFIPDIEKICKLLPPKRQTLFFSATMPPEIQRLVAQFLKDPARIEVAKPATAAQTITQQFRFCPDGEDWAKREILRELITTQNVKNAIIFCNRKRDVSILHKSLLKHGFNAGALHGDMDQKSRMETLDGFRSDKITFLAASDVAARGLDIPDVSHVFNFDVPWAGDDYVHRIGRTGRAGKQGFSATLVGPDDLKLIKDIERVTGDKPVWLGDPPTEEDIANSGKRRGRGGRAGRSGPASRGRGGSDRSRPSSSGGTRSGSDSRVDTRSNSRPTIAEEEAPATTAAAPSIEGKPATAERTKDGRRRRSRSTRQERQDRRDQSAQQSQTDQSQVRSSEDQPSEAQQESAPRQRPAGRQRSPSTREPVRPTQHSGENDRAGNRSGNRTGARDGRRRGGDAGGPNAFQADTMPAFLQRPVRPAQTKESAPANDASNAVADNSSNENGVGAREV